MTPRESGIRLGDTKIVRKKFRAFLHHTDWHNAYLEMHPPKHLVDRACKDLEIQGQGHRVPKIKENAKNIHMHSRRLVKAYSRLSKDGIPIVVKLMLVNVKQLNDQGGTALAMGLGSFSDPMLDTCTHDNDWALRAWDFRLSQAQNEEERSFARFREDEGFVFGTRCRVPSRLSSGQDAWLFHLNVVKKFGMPILDPHVVCLASPKSNGVIAVIPNHVFQP